MHRFFRWIRLILAFGAKECAKRFFIRTGLIYILTRQLHKRAAAAPIRQQKTWSHKISGTQRYHSKTGFPVCAQIVLFYLWHQCCPNKFLAFQSNHIHFSKSTFMTSMFNHVMQAIRGTYVFSGCFEFFVGFCQFSKYNFYNPTKKSPITS